MAVIATQTAAAYPPSRRTSSASSHPKGSPEWWRLRGALHDELGLKPWPDAQRELPGLASSSRIRKRDRTIIAQTRGSQHLRNLLPNRTSSFGILAIKSSEIAK